MSGTVNWIDPLRLIVVGYWDDIADHYLPLSALPVGAPAQREFFERARPVYVKTDEPL